MLGDTPVTLLLRNSLYLVPFYYSIILIHPVVVLIRVTARSILPELRLLLFILAIISLFLAAFSSTASFKNSWSISRHWSRINALFFRFLHLSTHAVSLNPHVYSSSAPSKTNILPFIVFLFRILWIKFAKYSLIFLSVNNSPFLLICQV